jgi:DNA repair exonuclease SbcCD ATPase subunit
MVLNIITMAVCFIMLIVFRRVDKSNMRMAKLRRYSTRIFDDFKKMADKESRKFNDATIEMDILIKKSNSLTKNLQSSLGEIERKLQGLDVEKTNLKKVEDDLKIVSHAARDVNDQIKFIAETKREFTDITKNMNSISDSMKKLKNQNSDMIQDFNSKIKHKSTELTEVFKKDINKLKEGYITNEDRMLKESENRILGFTEKYMESLKDLEEKLQDTGDMVLNSFKNKVDSAAKTVEGAQSLNKQVTDLKDVLDNLEEKVFADIKDKTSELKTEIDNSLSEFNANKTDLFKKVDIDVSRIQEKVTLVENNVNESKNKLIKTFENEVDKVRTELDNLSIHAISKKDDIVQAARREAEEITKKIDNFEEKYTKLESQIVSTADEKMESLDNEYNSIESRFERFIEQMDEQESRLGKAVSEEMGTIKNEFSTMEERLGEIKSEIVAYEERSRIFSRTDEMMAMMDKSIEEYNRMLAAVNSEKNVLEKFFEDVEHVKEIKKSYEKELRAYQSQKDKIVDIESEIKGLMEFSDVLISKFDTLREHSANVEIVNTKIDALSESYNDLESRIQELQEYENIIAKSIDSVNRSDVLIKTIEGKIKSVQSIVDRSDKRVEKLGQHLQEIEENTLILKSREGDIQEVKDRFGELEGLSVHIEKRIDQIYAMFQKVETLRKEVDQTDDRLQKMYQETDKKMKQFADFIQVVDNNNPILKQVNKDIDTNKNLNDNVIKTVRDLSSKGWSSDEISRKLLIDENSVRFIINTTSM